MKAEMLLHEEMEMEFAEAQTVNIVEIRAIHVVVENSK